MKILIYPFIILSMFFSCKNNTHDQKKDTKDISERLTNMNRIIVENESKKINDFIERHSYKTTMTGTGLRYEIYQHGTGTNKPAQNDSVVVKYSVYLLDGRLCYSADSVGPVKVHLGRGEDVRGLEEGILLLTTGDKAHLILPAHLAFGMSGDQKKIPPGASLFYDVELLKINK